MRVQDVNLLCKSVDPFSNGPSSTLTLTNTTTARMRCVPNNVCTTTAVPKEDILVVADPGNLGVVVYPRVLVVQAMQFGLLVHVELTRSKRQQIAVTTDKPTHFILPITARVPNLLLVVLVSCLLVLL